MKHRPDDFKEQIVLDSNIKEEITPSERKENEKQNGCLGSYWVSMKEGSKAEKKKSIPILDAKRFQE